MNSHPYTLFNKSLEQVRLLGARGGRTFSRNQRVRRRALVAMPQPPIPWNTRAARIMLSEVDIAQNSEARVNRATQPI